MKKNKKLVLINGKEFYGFGDFTNETIGEVVFNTSMVGYQEIITDPSYYSQIIVMSYPLIGNYGFNKDDNESDSIYINGLLCKEYNDDPSNFRSSQTLKEVLLEKNIPLLSGIETRSLVKEIRDNGTMLGIITDIDSQNNECIKRLKDFHVNKNMVKEVSVKKKVIYKTTKPKFHVVIVDLGTKTNILKSLNDNNCNVTIVPYNTSASEIFDLKPDGVLFNNGPSDPKDAEYTILLVKELMNKVPIVGIGLGHQIIALANDLDTYKLKFGHRGVNHPVKNLKTNKIAIVKENNSFTVSNVINNKNIEITHMNLIDNTISGIKKEDAYLFSVGYIPEENDFINDFINLMLKFKEDHHA